MMSAGKSPGNYLWIACMPLALGACGRTPLLPPSCDITIDPTAVDFGQVPPGQTATREVYLGNRGAAECHLSNIGASPTSDAWFSVVAPASMVVPPGGTAVLSVIFQPASASLPLNRTGQLTFDVDSARLPHAVVPLSATVLSNCKLEVSPTAVDFGHVALDSSVDRSVRLVSSGTGPCEIDGIALGPASDSQFHLGSGAPDPLVLAPGNEQSLSITFSAQDPKPPHHRTGTLVFGSNDSSRLNVTVALSADIDIGCNLTWVPTSLDLGNVILNTSVNGHVSLANDGSDACYVSGIAITSDSDPNFRLYATENSLVVAPGAIAGIAVTFSAADSSPPHLKTGTLVFQTGSSREPTARVPLSAFVDTVCVEASRWIYTLDNLGGFARFDPDTLTFTDIATLRCPSSSTPNSMAVDQNAVAWVGYQDGNLFKVDTATGACEATAFRSNQYGLQVFGMGFVFDPSTGRDTLYIAGGPTVSRSPSTLATVSFPDLLVTKVGTVDAGFPELTGTGDGQLWGFIPSAESTTYEAVLVRLDPDSGATLESYGYPGITAGGAWAMKFWGGSFWIFLGTSVYKASRDTPDIVQTAIRNTGRPAILGAGVSTCAPVQ
jgi:hypothetical protein